MGQDTDIEWADDTWNPAVGCTKVSAGCRGCYMMRDQTRYGRDGTVVRRTKPGTFDLPIKRDRHGAYKIAPGRLVFTASLTDVFHEDLDAFRDDVWARMEARPDLLFLVLTKRPERIEGRLPAWWGPHGPANVALGVSAEDQAAWDARVPILLDTPARLRFVSVEPMIGEITTPYGLRPGDAYAGDWLTPDRPGIGWVIIGGESGPAARPLHPAWVGSLILEADRHGVPVNFKQWGEWVEQGRNVHPNGSPVTRERAELHGGDWYLPDGTILSRAGKHNTGRTFRGRTYDARPSWPLEAP